MRSISLVAATASLVLIPLEAQQPRAMAFDDLASITTLTTVAPSPAGDQLALVIQRSWAASPAFRPYSMAGNDQADVWILPSAGSTPKNITRGVARNAGYWSPAWSPSGTRLAVLTTEGGDNVRVAVIDVRSGSRRVHSRGADTRLSLGPDADATTPFKWLDDTRLLVALLPTGVRPREFTARRATPETAAAAWARTHRGTETTVSVLSTDRANWPKRPASTLAVIDVGTGRSHELIAGTFTDVVSTDGGDRIALVKSASSGDTIVVLDARTGRRSSAVPGGAEALLWTPDGKLLAYGKRNGTQRNDWWLIDAVKASNLSAALPAPPHSNAVATRDSLLVTAQGKLWMIPFAGGAARADSLASGMITSIAFPRRKESQRSNSALLLSVRGETGRAFVRYSMSDGSMTELASRPAGAAPAAFDRRGIAYFIQDSPDGTFVTASDGGTLRRMHSMNEHLARVQTSRRVLLGYTSARGDSLKAVLLLPPASPAKPSPIVTWVYPGVVPLDTTSGSVDFWLRKNHAHGDNLHLLAAQGYTVLIPSMPASRDREPYEQLSDGVVPAVEATIRAGYGDSSKVALMGQSAGGYAVMGLLSQSDRFAAAIAINGISNLVSRYGTFSGESRYLHDPHVQDFFLRVDEQTLGGPPWEQTEKYMRNSPVAHVERVSTPLLLIHGDIDYVPIQQSEEFFVALNRLGKPAEFVRYWGESHGVSDSPANTKDRWDRMLKWLSRWM